MLNTQLPEEVRDALLTYHIVQDDLLDVQVLLDVVDDLPDGARYLPLGPGSTDPRRAPDDLSPKERFQLLIQTYECIRVGVLRSRRLGEAVLEGEARRRAARAHPQLAVDGGEVGAYGAGA